MNKKILIVASNYYKGITDTLIKGTLNTLKLNKKNSIIIKVPGTFEIPVIISKKLNCRFRMRNKRWNPSFWVYMQFNIYFIIKSFCKIKKTNRKWYYYSPKYESGKKKIFKKRKRSCTSSLRCNQKWLI